MLGIHAEDYYSDKTIEDADILYTGMTALPRNFWEQHGENMRSWKEAERTFYELTGPAVRWLAAQSMRVRGSRRRASRPSCAAVAGDTATLELTRDYRSARNSIWGITRAIASRTSRSICSWIRRSIS